MTMNSFHKAVYDMYFK